MTRLEANIWKLYFVKISQWFLLIMPVIFLFYQDAGLSMKQIFWVQTSFNGAAFLMEVPSGYVGDRLGRKFSLILGTLFASFGFFTYYLTSSFEFFILAAFLMGTGTSFISGSDSAMLYDTLLELKRERDYLKFEGRASAFGNFAESLAAICGGLIAIRFGMSNNVLVQGCLLLFACGLVISCQEPSIVKKENRKSFKDALFFILGEMKTNRRFRHIMMFSSFMGVNTLCMAWLVQPYLKLNLGWNISEQIKLTEILVMDWSLMKINGVAWVLTWAVLNFVVGVFAIFSSKINAIISKKSLVIVMVLFLTLPYFLITRNIPGLTVLSFFLFYSTRGVMTPLFREWINQSVVSEVRATALSIRAFIFRILFAALGPFIGYAIDLYSLNYALLGLGIFFFLLTIPYLLYTFSKK